VNVVRWVQRGAFIAAAGLVAASAWPGGGARAASAPSTFNAASTAVGVEYSFDRKPGLSQLDDPVHGASPRGTSTLGVGGVSEARASSVYLGGIEGLPGLLCLAGVPCSSFPVPSSLGGFPPQFPFEANAQYPSVQSADATFHGSTVGGSGAPLAAHPATTHAEAHLLSALTDASISSSQFLGTTLKTGSSTTTTSQSINSAGAVVTKAEAVVNNVDILSIPKVGPFIHIGAVHSVVTITYDGVKKPTIVNQTTVSGVRVAGSLDASIDQNGIHIVNQSNRSVQDQLNKQLEFLLSANYMTISVVGGATQTPDSHTINSQSGSLLLTFNDTVSGAPKAPPVTDIPGCKLLDPLQKFFDKNEIPVVLCTPPAPPDVNAQYFGTANIGSVGAIMNAANYSFLSQVPGANLGGQFPSSGGPTSTFVPGTAGSLGTSGTPSLGAGTGPNTASPQIAGSGRAVGFVENFGDAAKRLKYLFPALLLAAVGVLAGRIGRAPARLPRAST
jgi:hypothetical protein